MNTKARIVCLICITASPSTGCALFGGTVWTNPAVQTLKLDSAALASLEVKTENGEIEFVGNSGAVTDATVTATKRGGGRDAASADDALRNIQVFVEADGHGGRRVGWRWNGVKAPTWEAEVDFAIRAPEKLRLTTETHNGKVNVSGVVGDVKILTHNGEVKAKARGGKLDVETHNGEIAAQTDTSDLRLVTHNGKVLANLTQSAAIGGRVESFNGQIEIAVGPSASSDVSCETSNGRIRLDVPAEVSSKSVNSLRGKIGKGGTALSVSTHNGDIHLKNNAE